MEVNKELEKKWMNEDWDPEAEGAYSVNALRVIVMLFSMLSDCIGIYFNAKSNFYWYNLGKNMGGLPMKFFIFLDYVASWNVIVPTDPWVSYRYEREDYSNDCPVCPNSARAGNVATSYMHLDPQMTCEGRRARAIEAGCYDRGNDRRSTFDAVTEQAEDIADMSADYF